MSKKEDLTGIRFGKLIALTSFSENGRTYWNCQCDCGKIKKARSEYLKNGKTHSCGCARKTRLKDLSGKKFGRLTVDSHFIKKQKTYWNCYCDCGERTNVRADKLLDGHTKSCGCLLIDNAVEQLVENRHKNRIDGVDAKQLEQKLSARNKSGHTGVFYNKTKKVWFATIGVENKNIAIRCKDKQSAIDKRIELERIYHDPYIEKLKIKKRPSNNG